MPVAAIDYAHLRLTVTDITRSREFYDAVFGFDVLVEAPPADADAETKRKLAFVFGGVIYSFAGGVLGLRPVAPAGDRYDEDRVGLDHLSFAVAARSDLDDAVALLDELGVPHEDVKDIGSSFILEFRDPDNIALELTAPK
ncbi:VOC family protein [Subtercola sp. YIM 133946]|uniref:VOC family protein n=1 Tax=Subtercola sp. YIM 133946 TaxID=3118909 RepID=UPI002F948567